MGSGGLFACLSEEIMKTLHFLAKVALAIIVSNFLPPESEAQRTDFGVRLPPASPDKVNWPKQKFGNRPAALPG